MIDKRDKDNDRDVAERLATLEAETDGMKDDIKVAQSDIKDIKAKDQAWDDLLLSALFKFSTRLLTLIGVSIMFGNTKTIKQWVMDHLTW